MRSVTDLDGNTVYENSPTLLKMGLSIDILQEAMRLDAKTASEIILNISMTDNLMNRNVIA